jgi:hypothetical protein
MYFERDSTITSTGSVIKEAQLEAPSLGDSRLSPTVYRQSTVADAVYCATDVAKFATSDAQ